MLRVIWFWSFETSVIPRLFGVVVGKLEFFSAIELILFTKFYKFDSEKFYNELNKILELNFTTYKL